MNKHESETDSELLKVLESKEFNEGWRQKTINDLQVQKVLDKSSKSGKENRGEPDFIYKNENKRLLILIENKANIRFHQSKNEDKVKQYAVDGIKHYLKFFTSDILKSKFDFHIFEYFKNWKIVGIATSGSVNSEYDYEISTFTVNRNNIEDTNIKEILDEEDYIGYFDNIDYDQISQEISKSSLEINNLLRNLQSQKRPVLVSALMICLYPDDENQDFKNNYNSSSIKHAIENISLTVKSILGNQGIPKDKIEVLINELAFIKTDHDLNNTEIIKKILNKLETSVIPLFKKRSTFDIIGRFYEEFLRYAGVSNVKNGIVLTPNHIRNLFTELIEIKPNDVFIDPACGTGGLLISPMNKLEENIEKSNVRNKKQKIKNIKTNQLVGFEKDSTMYALSISNMLFRGDGKSNIYNMDFFCDEADSIIGDLKNPPTIGYVNPPYGGLDNDKNPTKKEIQFLERMLNRVSRYGIIIAPLSCYLQNDEIRNRILTHHTLKYVINMPIELFQPNASTATAVAVFETHKPHNNQEVIFYNLSDDGFILHKITGRSDRQNRWNNIKNEMLENIRFKTSKNLCYKEIRENEEWLYQAHCETDFTTITDRHFENTIKEYSIFLIKRNRDLLDSSLSELELLDLFRSDQISSEKIGGGCRIIYK
ncbi:MAG: N-6 DNA methylase [Flavobacteriaceae bacterium]|nr:N-6 DNA methylase [Flavobacteriaceae bacterium]